MARRSAFGSAGRGAIGGGVTFTFEGEADIKSALDALEASVSAELLEQAGLAGGQIVVNSMKDKVAVRTGKLRNQIGMEISEKTRYNVVVLIGLTKAGFYGRYLEHGASEMRARPFMRPAWDEKQGEAIGAARAVLAEAVTKS